MHQQIDALVHLQSKTRAHPTETLPLGPNWAWLCETLHWWNYDRVFVKVRRNASEDEARRQEFPWVMDFEACGFSQPDAQKHPVNSRLITQAQYDKLDETAEWYAADIADEFVELFRAHSQVPRVPNG